MSMNEHSFQFAAEKGGEGAMYGGAAGAGIALGLSLNEMAAIGGLIIAVTGFFVNLYYSRQRNKREQAREQRELEKHELVMKQLEDRS